MDASSNSRKIESGNSLLPRCARLCTALILSGSILTAAAAPASAASSHVPRQILVKSRATLSETELSAKFQRHGLIQKRKLQKSQVRILSVSEDAAVDSVLASLRDDPDVEFAERDFVAHTTYVPNDPMVLSGAAWHLSRIQSFGAWERTVGESDVIIAVLDSGVLATHSDLAGKVLTGYDFVNNDADPADDLGHGTAVTGTIIASGNNALGAAGAAFGCRVLPVKVVDASGFASYSTIAQGIRYAVDRGARVINISIAGNASSMTLQEAVDYAWANNVVVVASAGNDGTAVPMYPAACRNVLAVSALSESDALSSFSSHGSHLALSAPGENIWTTQRNAASPFGAWRGTSLSAPIVTAAAALVVSRNPTLSSAGIAGILKSTADDLGESGYDPGFGFGRVNLRRAVLVAGGESPDALPDIQTPPQPLDTNAPALTLLTAPKERSRLTASRVEFSGTASDDLSIREIVIDVNGVRTTAQGTDNWHAEVALAPGANLVRVWAVDAAGNASPPVSRNVTFVVMAELHLNTQGPGTILPNLNGRLLEIGKTYTVRAVPGSGQAFAGWLESGSQLRLLTFVMQSNLTFTASFVPSPFPAVKGNYMGLIADTNGVLPQTAGQFNVTVSASGLFTGKLQLGNGRHSVRGQLAIDGSARVIVARRGQTPLTMRLAVDLSATTDQLTGTVTDGQWVSAMTGDRNVFNAALNPAPQQGSRTFYLKQKDGSLTVGTGTSAIGSNGSIRTRGKLQDGRPFSAASILARNGDSALYLPLIAGSETVIGWLNYPAHSGVEAAGTVAWVRSGTNAFAATLEATALP